MVTYEDNQTITAKCRRSLFLTFFSTALVIALISLASPAWAQEVSAEGSVGAGPALIGLGIEGMASVPVDDDNSEQFGVGAGGSLDLEVNLHPFVGLHGGFTVIAFGAEEASEGTTWLGGRGGVRLHWATMMGAVSNDGWLDTHFNYGSSGGIQTAGFDVGVGYEFSIIKGLRAGPFVRYQLGTDPDDTSAQLVSVGVSIGFFGDPRSGATGDLDGDGVADADDQCPATPEGATPDRNRPGCPALDADGDGVFDAQDICPMEPAGGRPDPDQLGCPTRDQDGDGVVDRDDFCPDVAAGAAPDPNRRGCPTGDTDGDGIVDAEDQCPADHAGPNPDPEKRGCPAPDRDRDNVPDLVDKCPDEVGAPSNDPEKNGCPGLVQVTATKIEILEPIYFKTGSDEIKPSSRPVLQAVSDSMKKLGIRRLRIEGHTDSVGSDNYNEDLSRRRAQAVLRWLINSGVDAGGLEAIGFGEARPIDDNDTKEGRAKNRRVEFHILDAAFKSR